MSVVNGKHVILRSDVEQYRGDVILSEVLKIAQKDNLNPVDLMKAYSLNENPKLVEIVNQNVEIHLDVMVEELNKLILECEVN